MQVRDDKRIVMQAEIGDIVISSNNLVEVEHVRPFHDEVISSDNQFEYIDQLLETYILVRDWERRVIKALTKLGFEDVLAYALMIGGDDPTYYKEAISSNETNKLTIAMKEELESLHMVFVELPKGKKTIKCKRIFIYKRIFTHGFCGFFSVKNLYLQKMRKFLKSN